MRSSHPRSLIDHQSNGSKSQILVNSGAPVQTYFFCVTQVEDFLDEEGIKHEFSSPYTPQQNGVAERKNHTLNQIA
jgi:hypothetical protein